MQTCDLCKAQYQHGPHRYEGHKLDLYDIMICTICWEGNWDGFNPIHEETLLKILEEKGLPIPKRNSKGLLPRE